MKWRGSRVRTRNCPNRQKTQKAAIDVSLASRSTHRAVTVDYLVCLSIILKIADNLFDELFNRSSTLTRLSPCNLFSSPEILNVYDLITAIIEDKLLYMDR